VVFVLCIQIYCVGIGVFTFHKYHKSLESNVPVDAHGNPVTSQDDDAGYAGETSRNDNDERIRLTIQRDIDEALDRREGL